MAIPPMVIFPYTALRFISILYRDNSGLNTEIIILLISNKGIIYASYTHTFKYAIFGI